MTFQELNISASILKALEQEGYTTPTPIQENAIPVALQGKDIFGCAQTGTGKTASFAIPILQALQAEKATGNNYKHLRALILAPTRELAMQINDSFRAYGKYTGLTHQVIFGGVSQQQQVISLRNGTDILIATPGRLLDFMNQGYIHLSYLEVFVMDEADRMLDMGFIQDIKKIIRELPEERQTLFFSATMPPSILKLASSLMSNPVKIEVTPVSSTAEKINQAVYMVAKQDKPALLVELLKEAGTKSVLVFSRTKFTADKLAKYLNKANIDAGALHGNKTQAARESVLKAFKSGRLKVLIATDIASRGIDVDNLTKVINFDLPDTPETYVHRIGRTGRAGKEGVALSLCDPSERGALKDINKLTSQNIPIVAEHPFKLEPKRAVADTNNGNANGNGQPQRRPGNNFKSRQGQQNKFRNKHTAQSKKADA